MEFSDAAGKRLAGVLPFCLALVRPDGRVHTEFYRSTTSGGTFSMAIPVPANAPAGRWSVAVRSQLAGDLATLPVVVRPAKPAPPATALTESVVVRNRAGIEQMLAKSAKVCVPVFDGRLLPAAEKLKATLAARGVQVEIRQNPATNVYTIAYDPTDAQKQENARADRGESFGKIRRETVNGNDWASGLSGWRFGRPVVLLDIVGEKIANPLAGSLAGAGMLWPQVSPAFPGKGRAVVQAVSWAFAPRTTALVIQAADAEGLLAGAEALASLPGDRLTPGITAAKAALWRQYHIGGTPAAPQASGLTAKGLASGHAPRPFAMAFPSGKPPTAEQVKHAGPSASPAYPVPGTFAAKQLVLYYRVGEEFIETATAEFLMSDLRFSQALKLVAEVKTAAKLKVTATGVFRYSDRKPCWQAQWEDILKLRDKLVPHERRPMESEVRLGGKTVGKLTPGKVAQTEVVVEGGPAPKKTTEEAVTELSGEIQLPAGRQEILFIPRDIVDGKLEKVAVGQ